MENKNNISDELLATYLDGNTNEKETIQILQALKKDRALQETLDIALQIEEEKDILPMMQMAAESGENLCSALCETYILHRRNIDFDEKDLLTTARKNHWLKPEGAPLHAIGQILAYKGLMITRKYDATFDDISEAIALDNDVIVAIDSDKLYPEQPDENDAPNHAVVVTAIDPKTSTVTIYDPQHDTPSTIHASLFKKAWHESHHYMVRVLQSIEEYNPQPINLEDITLTEDLMELREAIAENAHDVWATARIKEGWTYGPVRNDKNKQHPDLIPYSALPDSEKKYDRVMALGTIKLVKKLGFDIVKH